MLSVVCAVHCVLGRRSPLAALELYPLAGALFLERERTTTETTTLPAGLTPEVLVALTAKINAIDDSVRSAGTPRRLEDSARTSSEALLRFFQLLSKMGKSHRFPT